MAAFERTWKVEESLAVLPEPKLKLTNALLEEKDKPGSTSMATVSVLGATLTELDVVGPSEPAVTLDVYVPAVDVLVNPEIAMRIGVLAGIETGEVTA